MFEKYNEVLELFNNRNPEIVSGDQGQVLKVLEEINQKFKVNLTLDDILKLVSTACFVEISRKQLSEAEKNFNVENGNANQSSEISNCMQQTKKLEIQRDMAVSKLCNRICIESYDGPLSLDIMEELSKKGYNGTYGSTSMKQMYELYQENIALRASNKQSRDELDKYYLERSKTHDKIVSLESRYEELKEQNNKLLQQIDSLCEKLSSIASNVFDRNFEEKDKPKHI